jgi:Universal stress protein UspA and related nucleotide-binding proteins
MANSVQPKTGNNGTPAMYRNILLPISRPGTVKSMVKIACDLLEQGGRLRILSVIEVPSQLPYEYADTRKDDARNLLSTAVDQATAEGVDVIPEIVSARSAPEAILDLASRYRSDMILMGSSQRTVPEKVLFGNVVDRVLRHAPCEVIVFSYPQQMYPVEYDRILVPTSGYKHSQRAVDVAISFVRKFGGSITAMYVGPSTDADKANIVLKKAEAHMARLGTCGCALFRTGNVVDEIIEEAVNGRYTLIIIGSTERPSYYKFLLGSVADEIVKRAPCNVLVVRTKK